MGTAIEVRSTNLAADDFMAHGYELIGEPLNLHDSGRTWFRHAFECIEDVPNGRALVLGATPWLVDYFLCQKRRVLVADRSQLMLDSLATGLKSQVPTSECLPLTCDWIDLPDAVADLAVTVGDNSFSFLPFPTAWCDLCRFLSGRMLPGAVLAIRICSPPRRHRRRPTEALIDEFIHSGRHNWTALRAALLFACWNADRGTICTQEALATFDVHRSAFDNLLGRYGDADNDLVTMEKYRGVNAIYYAPTLDRALEVIGDTFVIRSVHFGPYAMSEYFPLIIASRR
jgi:hypothetical protein